MKLITKEIEQTLRRNSEQQALSGECDHMPALKLFNPCGAATWLITEMDDDGRLFGLCDLGMGSPELGYVSLEEIEEYRGPLGIGIERDRWFTASAPISAYTEAAREKGRIIDALDPVSA